MNNSAYQNVARVGRWTWPAPASATPPASAMSRRPWRRIEELAGAHPRFGCRRIWALLDREGWAVNKKAVRRLYGPGFAAEAVRSWLEGTGSGALYVAPGSPWQNGYAESFHSRVRDEFLNLEEFENGPQARALGSLWKEEYNTERLHSSLGYQTPAEFSATCVRHVPIDEDLPDPSSSESTNSRLPLSPDQEMGSRPGAGRRVPLDLSCIPPRSG
jgi:Integrase core domain/HTH-like domain